MNLKKVQLSEGKVSLTKKNSSWISLDVSWPNFRNFLKVIRLVNKFSETTQHPEPLDLCKQSYQDVLKGQCHKMVVEIRPWSGSLALN
jgi:hypothetical protein